MEDGRTSRVTQRVVTVVTEVTINIYNVFVWIIKHTRQLWREVTEIKITHNKYNTPSTLLSSMSDRTFVTSNLLVRLWNTLFLLFIEMSNSRTKLTTAFCLHGFL